MNGKATFEGKLWLIGCAGLLTVAALGFSTATWIVIQAFRETNQT